MIHVAQICFWSSDVFMYTCAQWYRHIYVYNTNMFSNMYICTCVQMRTSIHPSVHPYIYNIRIYIYMCFGQEMHQHFRAHPITQICPSIFFEVFIFAETNQFLLKLVNFESWPLWGGVHFLSSIFKCVINHVFMSSRQNVPFETPVFLTWQCDQSTDLKCYNVPFNKTKTLQNMCHILHIITPFLLWNATEVSHAILDTQMVIWRSSDPTQYEISQQKMHEEL